MAPKTIDRRDFLRLSSLVLAGGYIGLRSAPADAGRMGGTGGTGGGGMGGGGSATVVDPPVGSLFQDPPEMHNMMNGVDGVVEVQMEARPARVDINGVTADLLTYNGHYPAPTIRVRAGEGNRLRVRFSNALPHGTNMLGHDMSVTNLHTHGLHVSPAGNSDNVMLTIPSPGTLAHYGYDGYEYDLSMQNPGSLCFYHPHVHGSVAEQYWKGLAGALVVEDAPEYGGSALAGYETHIMVVKDIALSGTVPAPYTSMMDYMHGKEGSLVLVNGQLNPRLPIRPGQVQRWRILNACNARFLDLSLEGHTVHLAGTDGGLLDRPYPVSRILLSPGERVDLLVKADRNAARYRLLALPYSRMGSHLSPQVTLLTMSYEGTRTTQSLPATDRVSLDPRAVRIDPDAVMPVATRRLVLSMGQGKGYINGIAFTDMDHAYAIHSMTGTWEIWEIVNQSGMDHPFHQHVNPAQLLSVSGGSAGYAQLYTTIPAWKDTVIVPKMGSVRILVPVMDYAGMAMFHCHIIEHEDIGMMGVWHIMDGGMGGM